MDNSHFDIAMNNRSQHTDSSADPFGPGNLDFGGSSDDFDFGAIDFNDPMLKDAFDFINRIADGETAPSLSNGSADMHSSMGAFQLGSMASGNSYDGGDMLGNPRFLSPSPLFLPDTDDTNDFLFPASDEAPLSTAANGEESSSSSTGELIDSSNQSTSNPANNAALPASFLLSSHVERNPLLPTQTVRVHPPKKTLTTAQAQTMNAAKAEKAKRAMLLKTDVIKLFDEHEEKIANLAKVHSVKPEYLKRLLTTASTLKRKRATGRIQALVHIKAQEENSTRPVGQKLKAPALRKLVDKDTELLEISKEKLEQAKREVDAQRLLSTRGARPNIASAGKDFGCTSRLIKNEFDSLHLRTGAVGFGVLAPGSGDDRGLPIWFVAGSNSVDFVRAHLNTTMWDLTGQLELWANTRKSGKPPTIPDLQSRSSNVIASGLRYILGNKSVGMNYVNYHRSIVGKYHVCLIGLPDLAIFKNANGPITPFLIKDQATLEALYTALEAGACHWARMSPDDIAEHNEWLKTQPVKERSVRSDKGQKRGRRTRGTESDDENESRESSRKRKRANKKGSSLQNSGRTTAKGRKTAAPKKSRVSKQLPPRSRETVDSDEDLDLDGDDGENDNEHDDDEDSENDDN
ncbi:hypothetical protein BT96DRAFT_933486 [Gymnopus androsaceus JB14]|uniref:Uncharacterized protein n=1 Tax=Gymnopus androsaceus JB14 TaxID=1447944 RepID=A0A6A4I642_9AGAR|nr:hypothetical protein BT96DRAFT_933486 [Gymnopus androsaceus JB14]